MHQEELEAAKDAAYAEGRRQALESVKASVLDELGQPHEQQTAAMVLPRTRRAICLLAEELGIDVPPDLHPADIVARHICPAVRELADGYAKYAKRRYGSRPGAEEKIGRG